LLVFWFDISQASTDSSTSVDLLAEIGSGGEKRARVGEAPRKNVASETEDYNKSITSLKNSEYYKTSLFYTEQAFDILSKVDSEKDLREKDINYYRLKAGSLGKRLQSGLIA